ncbi:MAG: Rrf2 family transcriptional regulator [Phycisphaerales bacterium]|nr:MAG: Rrf2 family transcriptional regulator [Phycisphaerales bacterium]
MHPTTTISRKCRYALRAIFELALRDTTEAVKVQDIAAAQAIPPRFLEVILAELKHGGFVESRRGKDGGYVLAREPRELTVGQVIGFLHGGPKRAEARPDLMGAYAFSGMWEAVNHAVSSVYDKTTFAGLVEQEVARRTAYVPNYAI